MPSARAGIAFRILADADRRLGAVHAGRPDRPRAHPSQPRISMVLTPPRGAVLRACWPPPWAPPRRGEPDQRAGAANADPDCACSSLGSAATAVSVLFEVKHLAGLSVAGWSTAQEVILPLIHYSIAFAGWSLCCFWIRAEIADRAEHRHAVKAEARRCERSSRNCACSSTPHFLFGHAERRRRRDSRRRPQAALAMLRDLTAYLRHSLAGASVNRGRRFGRGQRALRPTCASSRPASAHG